jgi:hypothetical protein
MDDLDKVRTRHTGSNTDYDARDIPWTIRTGQNGNTTGNIQGMLGHTMDDVDRVRRTSQKGVVSAN